MKIIILTAKAGGGHLAMATSLEEHFAGNYPEIECQVRRLNEYTGKTFEYLVNRSYIWLVNYMSHAYNYFYKRLDKNCEKKQRLAKIRMDDGKAPRMRYMFQASSMRRLKKILDREKPDVVISCYHYCNILAYKTRHKYNLDYKIINVFADFVVNSVYYCHMADAHVCSSDIDYNRLLDVGVPKEKIFFQGIPVNEKFKKRAPRESLFPYFHLPERKTVLVLGGAFGGGKLLKIAKELTREKLPCNLVFLCGVNKKLYKRLIKMSVLNNNIYAFGYTHEIDKFMDIADVLISKVGGNGISEALAKELPIIMVNPLPGQEEFNADYLEEKEMALYAHNLSELIPKIKMFLDDPGTFEAIRPNIKEYFNPDATGDICRLAVKMARQKSGNTAHDISAANPVRDILTADLSDPAFVPETAAGEDLIPSGSVNKQSAKNNIPDFH